MSRNNAFPDKHEKLKHYAAMAARMDEKMNTLIGRGAFTILTLDQLSLDPLGTMDMNTERLPPAGPGDSPAPLHETLAALPASYSPDNKIASADGLRTASVMTVLSIVCDVLLPLHAMMPLAQKIKRSAVLWYISGNRPEGIQIYTATFGQVIDIRQQRYQHYYSLNCTASLPPSRGIASHLRMIFRILKLQTCDNDDDEGDD